MTSSMLIAVPGSEDFRCDLGNFVQETKELTEECIWGTLKNAAETTLQRHKRYWLHLCCRWTPTATGQQAPGTSAGLQAPRCQCAPAWVRGYSAPASLCIHRSPPTVSLRLLGCRLKEHSSMQKSWAIPVSHPRDRTYLGNRGLGPFCGCRDVPWAALFLRPYRCSAAVQVTALPQLNRLPQACSKSDIPLLLHGHPGTLWSIVQCWTGALV